MVRCQLTLEQRTLRFKYSNMQYRLGTALHEWLLHCIEISVRYNWYAPKCDAGWLYQLPHDLLGKKSEPKGDGDFCAWIDK